MTCEHHESSEAWKNACLMKVKFFNNKKNYYMYIPKFKVKNMPKRKQKGEAFFLHSSRLFPEISDLLCDSSYWGLMWSITRNLRFNSTARLLMSFVFIVTIAVRVGLFYSVRTSITLQRYEKHVCLSGLLTFLSWWYDSHKLVFRRERWEISTDGAGTTAIIFTYEIHLTTMLLKCAASVFWKESVFHPRSR